MRLIETTWTAKSLDGGLEVVGTQVSALSDGDVADWLPGRRVVGSTIAPGSECYRVLVRNEQLLGDEL